MKNKLFSLILIFVLTGCGFASGLYKDILKAQDHVTNQKYDQAAKIYQSILEKKPPEIIKTKINFQLGEIYSIYLNDPQKSLKHFNNIIKESSEPVWQVKSLEKVGEIQFEEKMYDKAKKSYLKLTNFRPVLDKLPFYTFRLAISYFNLREYKRSRDVFEQLKTQKNKDYSYQSYYYLGLADFYEQKWNLAIKNWFEYLKRERRKDKIVQVKFLIANAYESSEKLKEAYNIYYSIIGEYPNSEVIKDKLDSLYKRRIARKR